MKSKMKRYRSVIVYVVILCIVCLVKFYFNTPSAAQEFREMTVAYQMDLSAYTPRQEVEISSQQLIEILNTNVIVEAGTTHDQSFGITTKNGLMYKGIWDGGSGLRNVPDGIDTWDVLNLISGYSQKMGWNLTIACE